MYLKGVNNDNDERASEASELSYVRVQSRFQIYSRPSIIRTSIIGTSIIWHHFRVNLLIDFAVLLIVPMYILTSSCTF